VTRPQRVGNEYSGRDGGADGRDRAGGSRPARDRHEEIFCGCSTEPEEDEEPNTRTCPTCLGLRARCRSSTRARRRGRREDRQGDRRRHPETTTFHRKNYYYPDLPKNFQLTQYDAPICQSGELEVRVDSEPRTIGITRAHLEEDPGSLQHAGGSIETATHTLVNYNRAGTPLMEIVTEPDFRSPAETRAFWRSWKRCWSTSASSTRPATGACASTPTSPLVPRARSPPTGRSATTPSPT